MFHVDGHVFGSAPAEPVGDRRIAPIVKQDAIDTLDYCPYCDIIYRKKVRPSGDPIGEGRWVVISGLRYPVCHLHCSSVSTGHLKKLPIIVPA